MRFYRGIAVPRDMIDAALSNIRTNGLQPGDGDWKMVAGDLKSRLAELWAKRPITLKDTRPDPAIAPSWVPLCDLAVQDNAVVRDHAANRLVIAGRYGTRFRSAFLVRLPVTADRITGVRVIETAFEPPEADVSLDDCLASRRA